jgi:CHAD domain-containing protein
VPAGVPPTPDIEVEWQFDAFDLRPVQRWIDAHLAGETRRLAGPGTTPGAIPPATSAPPGAGPDGGHAALTARARPAKRLVDTYMDSADWRVTRAGFVLRVRRRAGAEAARPATDGTEPSAAGGPAEVTLKDRAAAQAGLRRRLEVTETVHHGGLDVLGPDGPVGRRLQALVGSRPLQALFVVRTRRRPFTLFADGEPVGELALDETVVDVPDSAKPLRLQRVEVEVDHRWEKRLAPMVARLRAECGLQPATMSKFEAGLLSSGLTVPTGPDTGPTVLSPVPSVAELAFVVLRRNFELMLAHEPGTRLGEDPEDLHDMRVATRRMRAALSLFAEVLPARAQGIRSELGWVADALGKVRDLDVQLERIEPLTPVATPGTTGAVKDLAELLHHRRQEARGALLAVLDSARYERFVNSYAAMLRRGPPRRPVPATTPALLAVPDLVRARHVALTKAAKKARRSGDLDDFHRLRIRGKRLRYAVEFVSELYGPPAKTYARVVVRLQDALGAMQDARVAADQLHVLAVEEEDGLSRETVFALGGLAERFRQESITMAARVPRHLSALRGKRWQGLTSSMDRRRVEAARASGWPGLVRTRARPAPAGQASGPGPGSEGTTPAAPAGSGPLPPGPELPASTPP